MIKKLKPLLKQNMIIYNPKCVMIMNPACQPSSSSSTWKFSIWIMSNNLINRRYEIVGLQHILILIY